MAALDRVALPQAARGICCGATRTGKSTLAEQLCWQFLADHPKAQCLILDSKPRFRAEYEVNGFRASWRYRKWGYGAALPGSYVLPLQNPKAELAQVWRLKGRIAIAQVEHLHQLDLLRWAAEEFYESGNGKREKLLYVDEAADYFGSSGSFRPGDGILRIVRSGGERNVAFLASTQRPRGVPKSLLTELTMLYMFRLDYSKDVDHLTEMSLPEDVQMPEVDHSFYFWDKANRLKPPSNQYYIWRKEGERAHG